MAGVGWVWESEVGGEARAMLRGCLHRLRGKRRGCDFGYLCMLQCHPVSLLQGKALLSRWDGSPELGFREWHVCTKLHHGTDKECSQSERERGRETGRAQGILQNEPRLPQRAEVHRANLWAEVLDPDKTAALASSSSSKNK